jgi:hypothetical protein
MSMITQQFIENFENLPPQMQEEALDFVRFLNIKLAKTKTAPLAKEPNGKKVAEIMAEIAARGGAFHDITDPVAWQREIRKDRPLPGREE